jgi:hypothetical protein
MTSSPPRLSSSRPRTNAHINLAVLKLDLHVASAAGALDELDGLARILGHELQKRGEEVFAVPADAELHC